MAANPDRQRIEDTLRRLQSQGLINPDQSLRQVIPFLEKKVQTLQNVHTGDFWWILAGQCGGEASIFFCVGWDW